VKFAEKAGEGYLVRKKERGSFQPEWPPLLYEVHCH